MADIRNQLDRTELALKAAGLESPRLEAEWLFAHCLGCQRLDLYVRLNETISEVDIERLQSLVDRRTSREPLQYIIGEVEFCELVLKVDQRVLIPRPETELLVHLLRDKYLKKPQSILDLGTGSGVISLALANYFPQAKVTAVDASADALVLAKENAAINCLLERIQILASDWFAEVQEQFDCIVSNPPYLTQEEWETAEPEVQVHEPYQALVAENAGLKDLETIITEAKDYLKDGGLLVFETGISQHFALQKLCQRIGYSKTESLEDMHGRERFFIAWR